MTDRTLTEAEHQLICNALDNELTRLRNLYEDGLDAEALPRLEKLTNLIYDAATIVLEDVSHE